MTSYCISHGEGITRHLTRRFGSIRTPRCLGVHITVPAARQMRARGSLAAGMPANGFSRFGSNVICHLHVSSHPTPLHAYPRSPEG